MTNKKYRRLYHCLQYAQLFIPQKVKIESSCAEIMWLVLPEVKALQTESAAAISAQRWGSEWRQTATVMKRKRDRDGWIDSAPHMQTCLLINSCWQRANTLGSSVETSVTPAISLHAFQIGCPQPVTVGRRGQPTRPVTCQDTFLSLVRWDTSRCQSSLLHYCMWQRTRQAWFWQWWTTDGYEQLQRCTTRRRAAARNTLFIHQYGSWTCEIWLLGEFSSCLIYTILCKISWQPNASDSFLSYYGKKGKQIELFPAEWCSYVK